MNIVNETTVLRELLQNYSHGVRDVSGCCQYAIVNILGSLVTVIVSLTAMFCNASVIFVTFWSETLRVQTGNLFIVYLAAVDVLTAITVMVPSSIAVALDNWPFGEVLCKFHATMNLGCNCSTSNLLAAISLERIFAVLFPFKYRVIMTKKVAVVSCSFALAIGFSGSVFAAIKTSINYNYAEGVCTVDYKNDLVAIETIRVCIFQCFFIPVTVITVSNVAIALEAKRSQRRVQPFFVNRNNNINDSTCVENQSESFNLKIVKSMLVVTITYLLLFTPYSIGKGLKTAFGIELPLWFDYSSSILVFISSATNPFIYGIFRKDYRESYKSLLKMVSRKIRLARMQNRIHPA